MSDRVEIIDDADQPIVAVTELQADEVEEIAAPADAAGTATAAAIDAEKKAE